MLTKISKGLHSDFQNFLEQLESTNVKVHLIDNDCFLLLCSIVVVQGQRVVSEKARSA